MFKLVFVLIALPALAADTVERIDLSFGARFLDWSDSKQISNKSTMEEKMLSHSLDFKSEPLSPFILGDTILRLETFQWLTSQLGDDGDCLNIHPWLKKHIGDDLNKKKVELTNKINQTRKAELENLNTIYQLSKIDPLSADAKTTKVKFFKGIQGKEIEVTAHDFLMGTSNNGNGEYAKVNALNNDMNKEVIEGIMKYYAEYKEKLLVLQSNLNKMKSDGEASSTWEVGNEKYNLDGAYKFRYGATNGYVEPRIPFCHGEVRKVYTNQLKDRYHRNYNIWGAETMGTTAFEIATRDEHDKEFFKSMFKKIKSNDSFDLGRFYLSDPLLPSRKRVGIRYIPTPSGKVPRVLFSNFPENDFSQFMEKDIRLEPYEYSIYLRQVNLNNHFRNKFYSPVKKILSDKDRYISGLSSLDGLSDISKNQKLADLNLKDIPTKVENEYSTRISFSNHPIIPFSNTNKNMNKHIVDRMSQHLMGAIIGYSLTLGNKGVDSRRKAQISILNQDEGDEGATRHRYVQLLIEDLEMVEGYFKNFKINDNTNNNTADLGEDGISPGKETNYGLGNTAGPVETNNSLHAGTVVATKGKPVELPGLKISGMSTSASNIHELLKAAQARLGGGNFASAASGNGAFGKLKKIEDKSNSLSNSDSISETEPASRSLASVADHGKSGLSGAAGTGSGADGSVAQASSGVSASESEAKKNTESPYASKDKNGALAEAGGKGGPALKWKESGASGGYTTNNEALDDTERERVLASVDKDKVALATGMGDNLFDIVSKTYKRNLGRVLVGDSSSVQAPEKAINSEKKAELNKMLDQF